jgi:putative PIG3 family NAD(P)H quinone oxidoreductase
MKAIIIKEFGSSNNLKIEERPLPSPRPDELLIRIHCTALNRVDILQRQGKYAPPEGTSSILGLEIAGIVEKVGHDCRQWQKGQRIFGLLSGGGYAEYATIHHKMAFPIPQKFSFVEAAAVPEAFLTAFQALFWLGNLKKNQTVLIHAGASGVGTAAIQLAREIGALIITTAGSEKKLTMCQKLGATRVINYKQELFKERVLEWTHQQGVQLIIDFIGEPYWEQNLASLSPDGKLILLATLGGSVINEFDLRQLMKKRLHVITSTMRNRSLDYKIKLSQDFAKFALEKFESGILKPVVDKVFPWKSVSEAHEYMESNQNIGKIVLKIWD